MCRFCHIKFCTWSKDREFHVGFFRCKKRRFFAGKLDKSKYTYEPFSQMVIPKNATFYIMLIDPNKRFAQIKNRILKELHALCEIINT